MAKKRDDNGRFFELLSIAVAGGTSVRSACVEIGCSESHAYTLSSSPEFKSRVAALRTEITAEPVGRLTSGASQAVDTLVALLDVTSEPSIRLQASKAILAALSPLSELGELRARMDAIEARQ